MKKCCNFQITFSAIFLNFGGGIHAERFLKRGKQSSDGATNNFIGAFEHGSNRRVRIIFPKRLRLLPSVWNLSRAVPTKAKLKARGKVKARRAITVVVMFNASVGCNVTLPAVTDADDF